MSLTDPVAANRARLRRSAGWNGQSGVLLGLLIVAAAVAGRAFGTAFEQGFDNTDGGVQVLAFVAALASWLLLLLWTIIGTARGLPTAVGVGLAVTVFGGLLDATAGRGWMAAVWLTGLALLALGILRILRRSARVRGRALARDTGQLTMATLTDLDPPRPYSEASRGVLSTATFEFTDREGRQRWVQRPVFLNRDEEIPLGTTTRLWYAADAPGRDRSIVVELSEERPLFRR